MKKYNWTFDEKGTAVLNNDANGYFYEWAELEAGDKNMKELLEEFLGVGYDEINIRVKAKKGAIFIVIENDTI